VSEPANGGGSASWGKHLVSQLPWVFAMLVAGLLAFSRLEARYEVLNLRLQGVEKSVGKLEDTAALGVKSELDALRVELRKQRTSP